ncbi:MAG TPA: methylamine utilization protein [Verrucomicrobiae bacterium]|nr:methylamine utilization protein [Verrucomicrobiae bacterium]
MRRPLFACLLAAIAASPAGAGAAASNAPAFAGSLDVTVRDATGAPVEDAVIVAMPTSAASPKPKGERPAEVIDQIDKEFVPAVKVVQTGASLIFPNKDNIRHHVYSFSPAKKFELPLYKGVPAEAVVFDRPGVVILGCNIHDWMIGYLYVVDSPWFAKTGKDGSARLADLPAGEYDVEAFHPRAKDPAEPQHAKVTLGAAGGGPGPAGLAFEMALRAPARSTRPPRDGAGSYP